MLLGLPARRWAGGGLKQKMEEDVRSRRREEDPRYEDTCIQHLMSILTMLGAGLARPAPTAASTWAWRDKCSLAPLFQVFSNSDLL